MRFSFWLSQPGCTSSMPAAIHKLSTASGKVMEPPLLIYRSLFCGQPRIDANFRNRRPRWPGLVQTTWQICIDPRISLLCPEFRQSGALEEIRNMAGYPQLAGQKESKRYIRRPNPLHLPRSRSGRLRTQRPIFHLLLMVNHSNDSGHCTAGTAGSVGYWQPLGRIGRQT